MSETDDLAMARWEVATLTGRLRSLEAERDAAVEERDRHQRQAAGVRSTARTVADCRNSSTAWNGFQSTGSRGQEAAHTA